MQLLLNLLLLLVALGMPAYLVVRAKHFRIVLGATSFWLLAFLCAQVYRILNGLPPRGGITPAVEDWLMEGWLFGLAYAGLVRLFLEVLFLGCRALLVYQEQTERGLGISEVFPRIWRELNRTPDDSLSV